MGQSGPDRATIKSYVEADLAAWVQAQADASGRSVSSWLRFVLVRIRTEMAHDPALRRTLEGGGSSDGT